MVVEGARVERGESEREARRWLMGRKQKEKEEKIQTTYCDPVTDPQI